MGSPITMSGFNKVDFSMILEAVMTQESAPLKAMEAQQKALKGQASTFATLATKLASLESAAEALVKAGALAGTSASNSDPAAVTIATSGSSVPGTYDVVIEDLARAQVSASDDEYDDVDTTTVASGGTLRIGDKDVVIESPVTLQQLAKQINSTLGIAVQATVISPSPGKFKLVLTSKTTGEAGAFGITSTLTGGPAGQELSFAAEPAVAAKNAKIRVNNIQITSATNTVKDAIPGTTLTLLKEGTSAQTTVSTDTSSAKALVNTLVKSYNDFMKFAEDQRLAAARADDTSIGRDSMFRGLRGALRADLSGRYDVGSAHTGLAALGIEFDRAGKMTFDEKAFTEALAEDPGAVATLFTGTTGTPGVFRKLQQTLESYTQSGGLIYSTKDRIEKQAEAVGDRIHAMQDRLAVRRATLQQEYLAADMAMSRLNSQTQALSSIGNEYRLF